MSQLDLFDTPTTAAPAPQQPACPRCGQQVLRVHDTELAGNVPLEPEPIPITRPITADQLVYEPHPRIGWHRRWKPQRRGYPLYYIHECPSSSTSHEKEIKS